MVCGRDGAAGDGERAGERFAGAGAFWRGAMDGVAGGGLRFNAAGDAEPFSGAAGGGAANTWLVQPAAVPRLRVVHVGQNRRSEIGRNGGFHINRATPTSIGYLPSPKSGPGNGRGARSLL